MDDIPVSILNMPFGRVASLATDQLRHANAMAEAQLNAGHNSYWMLWNSLGGLQQYKPPYVRRLSDAELDERFAKLTLELKARREPPSIEAPEPRT
jgi:hypothetical protein